MMSLNSINTRTTTRIEQRRTTTQRQKSKCFTICCCYCRDECFNNNERERERERDDDNGSRRRCGKRRLVKPHILMARLSSLLLSLFLLIIGILFVVCSHQIISISYNVIVLVSSSNNNKHHLRGDSFLLSELKEKNIPPSLEASTSFFYCQIIGAILISFAFSTMLLLFQFTMKNGIQCGFFSNTSHDVNDDDNHEFDLDSSVGGWRHHHNNEMLPNEGVKALGQNDQASSLSEHEQGMDKCRMALVSHALLGLSMVFVGLCNSRYHEGIESSSSSSSLSLSRLSTNSTENAGNNNSDNGTNHEAGRVILLLVVGSIMIGIASMGLMASFWPIPKRTQSAPGHSDASYDTESREEHEGELPTGRETIAELAGSLRGRGGRLRKRRCCDSLWWRSRTDCTEEETDAGITNRDKSAERCNNRNGDAVAFAVTEMRSRNREDRSGEGGGNDNPGDKVKTNETKSSTVSTVFAFLKGKIAGKNGDDYDTVENDDYVDYHADADANDDDDEDDQFVENVELGKSSGNNAQNFRAASAAAVVGGVSTSSSFTAEDSLSTPLLSKDYLPQEELPDGRFAVQSNEEIIKEETSGFAEKVMSPLHVDLTAKERLEDSKDNDNNQNVQDDDWSVDGDEDGQQQRQQQCEKTKMTRTTKIINDEEEADEVESPVTAARAEADANNEESSSSNRSNRLTGIRRLLQLASPQKPCLYVGCIVLCIRLPFSLAIPHFVSTTFGALGREDYHGARMEILLLLVIGTIDAALDFWCVYLFGLAQERIVRGLRIDTFSSILRQEIGFFDLHNTGELTSRLTSDCGQMASELTWVFRFSIEASVRIIGIASYMVIRSPILGLATLSIVPFIAMANKWYGNFLQRNAKLVQEALATANSVAQETLSCIRTVISFAAEDVECIKYENQIEHQYYLNIKQLFARGVYFMVISTFLINTLLQAFILLLGVRLIQRDKLTTEVLLAFMLYQGQLQEYTLQLFNSYTSLLRSSGAGDKVFAILDRIPPPPGTGSLEAQILVATKTCTTIGETDDAEVIDWAMRDCYNSVEERGEEKEGFLLYYPSQKSPPSSSELKAAAAAAVEFRNVYFRYSTRPNDKVLSNFSFTIPPGSTVALVGQSGCGKSTVMSLLERFYDPEKGSVLVNGANIRSVNIEFHRRRIGIVTQEPTLFSGTILSNITYGMSAQTRQTRTRTTINEEEDDEEVMCAAPFSVIKAARLANAHDFIMSFPHKYHTQVGERGLQLSGGQKQRIAIARAIYKRPSILLLDEATSSLDSQSERLVQDALDRLLYSRRRTTGSGTGNITTIVVAHRLQTVRNADCIAVIKDGRVVEEGAHEELMAIASRAGAGPGAGAGAGYYRRMVEFADSSTGVLAD